jgi:hypothetical protein
VNNLQNQELSAKGAVIRSFDVSSADAASNLKNIDVLISTTSLATLDLQFRLVEAAHSAGVKLFVPTEYGDTSDGRLGPYFKLKQSIRAESAKLGLPTVAFFTGLWTEWIPHLGFDLNAGKININGQGDAQISATSIEDVARFIAYVLTTLPKDQLENAKFSIQGDVIVSIVINRVRVGCLIFFQTFNSLAASIANLSSKPIEITHIPRSVLEDKVRDDPNDTVSGVLLGWDLGQGLHPNKSSNDVYPDWNPKKVVDVLKALVH